MVGGDPAIATMCNPENSDQIQSNTSHIRKRKETERAGSLGSIMDGFFLFFEKNN